MRHRARSTADEADDHCSILVVMSRKTVKDWTLSDGTMLPAGTFIGVASDAMSTSEVCSVTHLPAVHLSYRLSKQLLFQDAHTFKPFRFAEMRDGDGELDSIKHHLVVLSNDHIIFGHGRRAWYVVSSEPAGNTFHTLLSPGRFFAANGMKTIFTHILLNYDIQLENGSMERPPNTYFETSAVPNQQAKVMFRKRRD